MIRAALVVAHLTFHEARRRRLLWVVLILGGAFLLCFGTGLHFIAAEIRENAHKGPMGADRMALNFVVMAALYAVNFLIVMVSVLVPIETLSGEIASGAIESLATKPVPRGAIVLGKWLGCWALVASYVALLAGGVLLVAKIVARFTPPGIAIGLPLMLLEAGVLLTISLASPVRRVPAAIEIVSRTPASSSMSGRPIAIPGGVKRATTFATSSTPPASSATYAATRAQQPIHLPSTMAARGTGLVARPSIAPEAISPDNVSIGTSTDTMTIRKLTA